MRDRVVSDHAVVVDTRPRVDDGAPTDIGEGPDDCSAQDGGARADPRSTCDLRAVGNERMCGET
jgi:hypothetical protein